MSQTNPSCRCVICEDHGDRDDLDPIETDTIRDVRRFGWSVLMITEDDQGPGWAYTVGLWHSHGVPDLAMFGLEVEAMRSCLNTLGERIGAGRPPVAGEVRDDVIEGYPVHLKPVEHGWTEAFFGQAIGFYRRAPYPFLQVVWPDRDGHFHWSPDGDEQLARQQPQLWLRPDEHPDGVWTQDL